MKKEYVKPDVDKISFNYRDQVVAASAGEPGNSESGGSVMENSVGIGSPICGSGGIVDRVFDIFGSTLCE